MQKHFKILILIEQFKISNFHEISNSHIHKIVTLKHNWILIPHSYPINLYGNGMSGIFFSIFVSCEQLIVSQIVKIYAFCVSSSYQWHSCIVKSEFLSFSGNTELLRNFALGSLLNKVWQGSATLCLQTRRWKLGNDSEVFVS